MAKDEAKERRINLRKKEYTPLAGREYSKNRVATWTVFDAVVPKYRYRGLASLVSIDCMRIT